MSEIGVKPPRNIVIPLEVCSLIMAPCESDTEYNFIEIPNQVLIF